MISNFDLGHNPEEILSLADQVTHSGGVTQTGNILASLQLVFTPATGPDAPFCVGGAGAGTNADPYIGATKCTLPNLNSTITTLNFSNYTVVAADYDLPGHRVTDQGQLVWRDLCTVDAVGCSTLNQNATAPGSSRVAVAPAIDIEKATNGDDADTPTGPIVLVGSTVTWLYLVTNTGDVPLSNVTVSDTDLGAITCPTTSLAVGASMTCIATGTATAGQYANGSTATGHFSDLTVTDSDPSHYFGANPDLEIVKLTNGTDNTCPTVAVGSTVTWTYTVTNTGNVTLTNILVRDDNGTPGNAADDFTVGTIASLAAGASQAFTATGTAIAGPYNNVATASSTYTATATSSITVTDTEPDCYVGEAPGGATLLIIDEDSLDNGIHFHPTGGLITPAGPSFFSKLDVNDDKPSHTMRDVLRYFGPANNDPPKTITVTTGRTNDEGWFAPACIPQKWLAGGKGNSCLTDATGRQTGITNYWSGPVPRQDRLDKIPWVIPLRALGLNTLVGKDVCAVVYDSDISINYDHGTKLGVNGNLQGETLGIAAFHVDLARTLDNFSSSTLPQMTITIRPTSICSNFTLFNAPVPESSSVPNDRLIPPSEAGYRSLKVFPGLPDFF